MVSLVLLILLPSSPSDVRKSVVGRIAVREVTALLACGAQANKSLQHKTMNGPLEALAVSPKCYLAIALACNEVSELDPFLAQNGHKPKRSAKRNDFQLRPNGPIIPDSVSWKSFDPPVLNDRLGFRHEPPPRKVVDVQGGRRGQNPLATRSL